MLHRSEKVLQILITDRRTCRDVATLIVFEVERDVLRLQGDISISVRGYSIDRDVGCATATAATTVAL